MRATHENVLQRVRLVGAASSEDDAALLSAIRLSPGRRGAAAETPAISVTLHHGLNRLTARGMPAFQQLCL